MKPKRPTRPTAAEVDAVVMKMRAIFWAKDFGANDFYGQHPATIKCWRRLARWHLREMQNATGTDDAGYAELSS